MLFNTDYTPNDLKEFKSLIAAGNKKLPVTTAIFNLGSATDCPSRKLGLCTVAKECYAMKAEIQYPAPLPYRRRQIDFWNRTSAEKFAVMFLAMNDRKRKKFDTLRINESGDFYCQADIEKLEKIASYLKSASLIETYCYSARKDLDFSKCEILTVNGSNFMGHNRFLAVAKPTGINFVCPGSCKSCSVCSKKIRQTIEVVLH